MQNYMANIVIAYGPNVQREASLLSKHLERCGFATRLVGGNTERNAAEVISILLLAIPLRTFLEAFGTSLGESAGTAFKSVIREIFRRGDKSERVRVVILRDFQTGRDYELSEDLSVEAYEQLITEDSSNAGRYYYNDATGKWDK